MNKLLCKGAPNIEPKGLQQIFNWLISSPDLLLPEQLSPPVKLKLNLDAKNQPTQSLKLPRRVGQQFELMINQYLECHPYITDIKRNIQIYNQKITLGELDSIFQMDQQWFHLEMAVKFYLKLGSSGQLEDWVGPNLKDNLGKKWRRMLNHQSQLTCLDESKSYLSDMQISEITPLVWVKGSLFQHPQDQSNSYPYPINPSHSRGWWVRKAELVKHLNSSGLAGGYIVPSKPNWLTPIAQYKGRTLTLAQLQSRVRDFKQPELIWCVLGEGASRQIISRGFVVPDDWAHDYVI